jgi:hypothetical protein
VDPILVEGLQQSDGVLVVRAVQGVSGGRRGFRVTLGSGTDEEPTVTVVPDVGTLHQVIDDWVASLGS